MYFVKYGKEYLHDPRTDNYILIDLSLECEENSCGYCDFTIYSNHPMYDKLQERDSENPIEVYDDDILLFSGFIYELGKEFYLEGQVKCKGELDYLNDSIVRPYSTHQRGYGNKAPDTVNGYFAWLIEQHNNQVKSSKQFVVGINQGDKLDSNNYLYRENDQYPKTLSEISEKLLNDENIGGYLTTRHEKGIRYIDYLSEWTSSNSQILDFGVNLTDYTQTDNSSEIATFIVPTGAKMSETNYEYNNGYFKTTDSDVTSRKKYYTKSDDGYSECSVLTAFESGVTYYEYDEVNDESNLLLTINGTGSYETNDNDYIISDDMIYCVSAVKKYGWIGTTYSNSNITLRENLISKSVSALKELISPKRTIEIKAVDMHLINSKIKPIRIGEYVRVRSKPHNLDSYFLCKNIDLDLNNPENSIYTLGVTYDTLTGQQNKKINDLNKTINEQYESVNSTNTEVKKIVKENSETVKQTASDISQINTELSNKIEILSDEISLDYAKKTDILNAAKTATSFIKNTDNTIVIGNMTTEILENNIKINNDSVDICYGDTVITSFNKNQNCILWSGSYFMDELQSINFLTNITQQLNGAVFCWCEYSDGTATNENWIYFFVPKNQIVNHEGSFIRMCEPYIGMMKGLYVSNSSAVGTENNATSGVTNGIAWDNTKYVLRYVIGI